ncbi:TetR/AcrR family transcriptional regulator [Terrihabitans sp. B22-R8]|uniref:TetR/AcrR family transcriptional regulator n=1 Tax=Terrihabitans sp. B22-R8 TaxID=3425128 RepID=UPI00403C177D
MRKSVLRGEGKTRQNILAAAAERFAGASYDDVSLRDLAADVEVDVAYVHRSFGSKENLFRAVLESRSARSDLSNVAVDDLGKYYAQALLTRPLREQDDGPKPLLILIRSLASTTAGALVSERLHNDFIEPLRQKIGDPDPARASMIMSLLIGFSILRNLLQTSAAAGIEAAEGEALMAQAIQAIQAIIEPPPRGEPSA